ncbi:MAG: hypothetical protein GF311_28120 [Candidatus Lokiarchaeota archaeon]|nr:hypothetical protein [Candidatus Lokiarchaeota archaeon]
MNSNFISFVVEYCKKIKKLINVIQDNHILPEEVNRVLAQYGIILSDLNLEYQEIKELHLKKELELGQWRDLHFCEVKDDMKKDAPRSIKLAVSEIEMEMKRRFPNYYDLEESYRMLDLKKSYILKLMQDLDKITDRIRTLSNNLRSEMKLSKISFDYEEDVPIKGRLVSNGAD